MYMSKKAYNGSICACWQRKSTKSLIYTEQASAYNVEGVPKSKEVSMQQNRDDDTQHV